MAEVSRAFVGRGPVVAALRTAIDAALSGVPRLVLLTGEPGIGKTALAGQVTADAVERGARTGWGACWDGDGVPAFWPWRQVLRSIIDDAAAVFEPLDNSGPADARFRLFATVADTLADAAAQAGLVVVIDDLQWADPGTLRLLAFVIRHLRSARLLVLGTFREVDPEPSPELRGFLADVAAEAATFTLTGLGEAEVAALLAAVAGTVPADIAASVCRRTGGNPLFVQETGRLLATDGPAGLATVPVAVRDTIARRLRRLPPEVYEVLGTAALLGARFDPGVLAEVCDAEPAVIAAALEMAERERVIVTSEGGVGFAHDLFRETLAGGLDPSTRRRWHRRAGDALQRRHLGAAEVAYHYASAGPEVEPERVVAASVAAASAATAGLAYEEAVRHLRLAVRLADPERAGALWLELGDAARRLGDEPEARAAYGHAARAGDSGLLARAALGLHFLGTSSEQPHAEVIGLLERAADAVAEPSSLQAQVLAALARERADGIDAERDRAVELAERAVRVARATGHQQTLAFCLFAQHDVVWAPGTASRRLAIAGEMAEAAGKDPELAFEAAFCRFTALVDLGDADFEVALRDMDRLAEASRLPRQRFFVTSRRAMVAVLRGEDAQAREYIEEADRLGEMIGHPDTVGVRLTQLLIMGLAREGPAAAGRLEREFGVVAPAEFAPEMRALAALAEGQPEVAAAIIRAAEPALRRARFRWRALSAIALDVEIAVAAGAWDLCERWYDQMLPYEDEVVDIGGATAVMGPVSLYLGLMAQVAGWPDRAERHWAAALEVARRIGATPLVARIEDLIGGTGAAGGTFRRDGGVWTLAYAGTTVSLPDAKGLHDIAALLAVPGTDVPALRLLAGAAGVAYGSDAVLDETAGTAYRKRLADLDDDLDTATLDGDTDRVRALAAERDAVMAALTEAVGLGGRSRRLGDPGERARTTVTARIRDALRKIEGQHPALGAHLRASLVTGRICRYQPPTAVRWRL